MKKYIFIILLFNYLLVFVGCTSFKNKLTPTANKGGYIIKIISKQSEINSGEVTIKGTVFDVKTGKPLTPPVLLTIGCIKIQTSSQGEFSFKTKNFKNDYFFIQAISVGYRTIETNLIDLYNKNEVQIDFYLSEDDRPLIDCIPVPEKVAKH